MMGIFLDTETNGLNPQIHKALEIAFQLVDLATAEVKDTYQTLICPSLANWEKGDPESLRVTGFSWEEVSRGKTPAVVSQEIIHLFKKHQVIRKKAVFICQNPSFDRAFFGQLVTPETQELLSWPYHWLDLASMHWALAIDRVKHGKGALPWEIGVSKDLIASYYHLPMEAKPHRAMNGVEHLLLCYRAVVGFVSRG